jgi:beta-glucosidase
VKDSAESGIMSIHAGIDYDLGSNGAFANLAEYVKRGLVTQEDLNRAVKNVLRVKFVCGLFENPYPDLLNLKNNTNNDQHKALALEAAQKAMVLLKNDKNTLPLDAGKIKTLAVIGPNAAEIRLGGYSNYPNRGISVLEGIQKFAENKFKVLYAEGCKLTLNKEVHWLTVAENPILNSPEDDAKLIQEAVKVAMRSDAVVVAIGENELICREAWAENHLGDRDNLDLVGSQNKLVQALLQTGKPLVVLLINGRPISINEIAEKAPAIIECWYLGVETGTAVASVLFGNVNPSGKLTVTFPRSVGQLPCFYNHKPSRFRNYVLADSTPLYPFGFGLSYTTFRYDNLKLSSSNIKVGESVEVSVDITNTGNVAGEEITQLYIHDLVSLPVRPVLELKDFSRVSLQPDETKKVIFRLTPQKMESIAMDVKTREVQPGEFEIMVGQSSVHGLKTILTVE